MTASTPEPAAPHLQYGVNLGREAGPELIASARKAERLGFDLVTSADHWGSPDPFPMLAAAAAVTERVRLRSYVLDIGFWHPGLLARTASTLDALSGGRFELGLGAGHMRHEHEALGLPFPPHAERVAALAAAVAELRERLSDPQHRPAPVQHPVPIVIGAMSRAGLELAAREAEVVALSGAVQVPGAPAGTLTLVSAAQTDEWVQWVRKLAAGRPILLDALLQQVVIDRPPEQAAAEAAAEEGSRMTAAQLLDTPFVLYADGARAAAAELHRRAERWGITSWCTHPASGDALAEVLAADRG